MRFACVGSSSCRTQICALMQSAVSSSSLAAVQLPEAGQRDASVGVDVAVGALVHALNQVLLVQQRVVGAQRAGGIVETLVVMAELRLPPGRQELVHVHHLAQRHHQDGAWTGSRGHEDTLQSFSDSLVLPLLCLYKSNKIE